MATALPNFGYPKKILADISPSGPFEVSIITVGSALQDVFISTRDIEFKTNAGTSPGAKKLIIEAGEKNSADSVKISTGGGATNAAVTFGRHGYRVDFMGKIGTAFYDRGQKPPVDRNSLRGFDHAGQMILSDLQKENVGISKVVPAYNASTGYSTIIMAPDGDDHMIFTYRGASAEYQLEDFNLVGHEHYDWAYISSLAGNMDVLRKLLNQASDLGTKVFLNPGCKELDKVDELIPLLRYVDVILVNRKEAGRIVEGNDLGELIRNLLTYVPVGIITDGSNGSIVSDGKVIVRAGVYDPSSPVVDTTGAGDAFGSGFLSYFANGRSLKDSITFAAANSRSVVGRIGAKDGILHRNAILCDEKIAFSQSSF